MFLSDKGVIVMTVRFLVRDRLDLDNLIAMGMDWILASCQFDFERAEQDVEDRCEHQAEEGHAQHP